MPGEDQYVHFWTFKDRLTLQVVGNSSYYDDSFLNDELEEIREELLRGLDVA